MKFSKRNLSEIPVGEAHGGSGSRQMMLNESLHLSKKWEAVTKRIFAKGSNV